MSARSFSKMLAALGCSLAGCLVPGGPELLALDTEPPVIWSTVPKVGEPISPTAAAKVTFSEPLDPATLEPGFSAETDGEAVALVLSWPPEPLPQPYAADAGREGWTVEVRPAGGVWPETALLRVETRVTDRAGLALHSGLELSITAAP